MIIDHELLLKLRNRNLKHFFQIYVGHILFIVALQVLALGLQTFIDNYKVVFYVLSLTLVAFVICSYLFYKLNNECYHYLMNDDQTSEAKAEHLRQFHLRGPGFLALAMLVALIMTIAACFKMDILMTLFQLIIFYTMGHFVILMAVIIFFYVEKTTYFPLAHDIPWKPLSMSGKLIIPLGYIISIILSSVCAISYRISYLQIDDNYKTQMSSYIVAQSDVLTNVLGEIEAELKGFGLSDEVQSMDMPKVGRFLESVHEQRNGNIELLVAFNANGMGITSLNQSLDFSNNPSFLEAVKGKTVVLPTHLNVVTGKQVTGIICPIRKKADHTIIGAMGATITLDVLTESFDDIITMTDRASIWVIDKTGKVLIHNDHAMIGMTINKTPYLTNNDEDVHDIDKLLTAREGIPFQFILDDEEKAIRMTNETTGWIIAITQHYTVFLSGLNDMVFNVLILINLLAFLLAVPSFIITLSISKSIRAAIEAITTLSTGQLNVDTSQIRIFSDEMGYLLHSFNDFTEKLRTIITSASETSYLLESSSEELADASRALSDGAQSRAASVEEATAAIEEVTSSVEQISNNAETQMSYATTTFDSVTRLKAELEYVLKFASNGIETSNKTSKQAQVGTKMMQDTIAGMDNIDNSTLQIAEMVNTISTISDQVNLLALNASIEAARAGEHGKGFAIVAEEISKLADETATTAKNITDLVKIGLKEVATGRRFVDNTKTTFDSILTLIGETGGVIEEISKGAKRHYGFAEKLLDNTKNVLDMAESINTSTNEQMVTNQEMSKTIEQINQGTLSEAARSEEIASSAADINSQAGRLMQDIKFFKLK